MKYNVGYQLRPESDWIDAIVENREHISEMYFAWGDMPNGRNSLPNTGKIEPWDAQRRQLDDIKRVHEAGIKLNMLFNANCYGAKSLSRALYEQIGNAVDYVATHFSTPVVTTTSPLIARFIHMNFEGVEVRASVNMDIGTERGMDYVKDVYDSFYMQREYNRDFDRIERLSRWCKENGKGLYLLANSGCLNDCSAHVFHDNLVAHEADMRDYDNAFQFQGQCWHYLADENHRFSVLRDTSYIRPEDIHIYDQWFTSAKLATRVSRNPMETLRAYVRGKYSGSLLNLMEPNHSGALYPVVLENSKIEEGYGEHVLHCSKDCRNCDYCKRVFEKACVTLNDDGILDISSGGGCAG